MVAPSPPAELAGQIESLHAASFGWALACCGRDRDQAREVLQQVYCKVLSGKARFHGRSTLRTWLFGVIRLTAREQRRWSWLPWAGQGATPASAPRPDEVAAAREEAAALSAALAGLSARQREVLHLVFYEDLSISEAAQIMNVSLGSARQHYERGKSNLLAALTKKGGRP